MKIKKLSSFPPAIDIFSALRTDRKAVFLDSSLQGKDGRYSIIGLDPYLELIQKDSLFVNGQKTDGRISLYLKDYLAHHPIEKTEDLPLTKGCIGYFSYDYGRREMGIPSKKESDRIPEAAWVFYDKFIIEDHQTHTMSIICNGEGTFDDSTEALYQSIMEIDVSEFREAAPPAQVSADFTEEDYRNAVTGMISHIYEGDIYVVNMTQQLQIRSSMDPYQMFLNLREKNPSPFGAYMDFGSYQIVCASPERFLRVQSGKVQTSPIKGTRKRGSTPEEDEALRKELEDSEKEHSELLMIVDLERNDLSRVCRPGSVKVTDLFYVESYATVHHLQTDIEGHLREDKNLMDLLKAAFPGGSITGAPKRRAMELIDELEHTTRNLYTGSLGYLSLDGSCDLNIVIRTAVYADGIYKLGVGGGITCESDPGFEYIETLQKARALLEALGIKKEDGNEYYSG